LHVPKLTEPRWYLVQINDTFDEVADNVGGINGQTPGSSSTASCGERVGGRGGS
jgi:hypothetical protein